MRRRVPVPRLLSDEHEAIVRSLVFDATHFRDISLEDSDDLFSDILKIDHAIQNGVDLPRDSMIRTKSRLHARGSGASVRFRTSYFILALAAVFQKFNKFGERAKIVPYENPNSLAVGSTEKATLYGSAFFDFVGAAKAAMMGAVPGLEEPDYGSIGREILQKWRAKFREPEFDEFVGSSPPDFKTRIERLVSIK